MLDRQAVAGAGVGEHVEAVLTVPAAVGDVAGARDLFRGLGVAPDTVVHQCLAVAKAGYFLIPPSPFVIDKNSFFRLYTITITCRKHAYPTAPLKHA